MAAAKALMTTDTKPKQVSVRQKGLEVGGICKGAGMIAPEMATMLCFITTNADIKQSRLQKALEDSVEKSFNMTLVDGDTSTNDTVILISSCRRKCSESRFQKLLDYVTTGLAKKIAQDGEGASKYLEFEVKNAGNPKEAREVARALAASPLVKTAFYGENPNWGRIISTIGNTTGVNPMKITINYSSRNGTVDVFNQGRNGDLKKAEKVLKQKGIRISVNLRKGKAKAVSYTCDLTEEYVKVNAGYS
jgi:glutamate N-acetyltransferase/amino-acid N-acetyltransferase